MKRIILIGALLAALFSSSAHAAPLHRGSKGQRVCDAQWLLSGHRPSAYPWLRVYKVRKPPARGAGCQYGAKTIAAVREAKRQLGFKLRWNGTAGKDFLEILQGKRARPLGYVVRAAKVKAQDDARRRAALRGTYGARAISVGRSQLGCVETPWGSNSGPCVSRFQAVTGAFRAPWCASFTQWVYLNSGLGTFADRSAGVFYIVGWARQRGLLRTYPRPGWLVAFVDRLGHIGLVESTSKSGFTSIEGNASNRVLRRYHPYGTRPEVYIAIPGVDRLVP